MHYALPGFYQQISACNDTLVCAGKGIKMDTSLGCQKSSEKNVKMDARPVRRQNDLLSLSPLAAARH